MATCSWRSLDAAADLGEREKELFDVYELSESRAKVYLAVASARNLPEVDAEQLVWATCVATIGVAEGEEERIAAVVEERVHRLEEAERRYGWLRGEWTRPVMTRLVKTWACGLMVVDPALVAKDGAVMQWTHEYYGDDYYPNKEEQTDEWKVESTTMFAMMVRSIVRAYPMATARGIVSFSTMQDFDWEKYDMETKRRNADVTSLIPLKLKRMISVRPDDKMRGFFKEMGPKMLQKWGFVAYDDFESAVAGEAGLLPEQLPTFVGGGYKLDVRACLQALFRTEPQALALCMEVFDEMEAAGTLPRPGHMEFI